jgi:hypothetical protein
MTRNPHAGDLDADLTRAVRSASVVRQVFYVVVLLVALTGQVMGAHEALGIPVAFAIPAVGALELGGIVVLSNADVRRRLGERATASRLLSAGIAAGAVAFNLVTHSDPLLAAFFAGMSALGYLVWLMHTENQRRDRLRATGDLPPTTPAYELGQWLRHPALTARAKSLAKSNPDLGLYASLDAARTQVRTERRQAAIAKVLHRKIRAAVDPLTADIACATYDLDQVAARLAASADYDTLTALIAADLTADRLAATDAPAPMPSRPAGHDASRDAGQTRQMAEPDADAAPAAPAPTAAKPTRSHVKRRSTSADKVAKAAAKMPGATVAAIAARAGVSESTARRYLPTARPALADAA